MIRPEITYSPHPFAESDLPYDVLKDGIKDSLNTFTQWRDANPGVIAEYIDDLTHTVGSVARSYRLNRSIGRLLVPHASRRFESAHEADYINYFAIHNIGEEPSVERMALLRDRFHGARRDAHKKRLPFQAYSSVVHASLDGVRQLEPELQTLAKMDWLELQVENLYTILPEKLIREGGMGKVVRTMLGVLAIAAYDVADETDETKRSHFERIIPGAYALGAAYALFDDVLQSESDTTLSPGTKDTFHTVVTEWLTTGADIDTKRLPNHPLAEELRRIQHMLSVSYPFAEYRRLYYAIESMFVAQGHDKDITPESVMHEGGIASMYPDMAIKASMTRVVANILGRRAVADENYTILLNTVLSSQLKDDFHDQVNDEEEGNCTIFTMPYNDDPGQPNPLYDLFAYEAYIARAVWAGHPDAERARMRFGTAEVVPYLAAHRQEGRRIFNKFPTTDEVRRFMEHATQLSKRGARKVSPYDMRLETSLGRALQRRDQSDVDPRTFISDRLDYVNEVVGQSIEEDSFLATIAHYSLEAGGKRLRPVLTLMLADSLDVSPDHIKPLLVTAELFHTGSLIFDDLPAQDNSELRRARPTAHIAFNEWGAQLAGLSMISRGFGALTDLAEHFPAKSVLEVVKYADSILGFEGLCKGQAMDLSMTDDKTSNDAVIEMYRLKTSLAIEGALVPLMILTGRSGEEIDLIKQYAYHTGIIFQLRDDVLDITAAKEQLGKSTQIDEDKVNIARRRGIDFAEDLIEKHLNAVVICCEQLPFDTNLLVQLARHLVNRTS